MRNSLLVALLLVALLVIPITLHYASAHVEKTFGNISVKVEMLNEPPLVGDTNEIQVFIDTVSGNTTMPISQTGLDNMNVVVTYGGLQKTLQFTPSDDTPDEYDTTIIPTKVGSYQVIMNGTIIGQAVNAAFPLDEVEDKGKYYQPAGSTPSETSNSSATITTIQTNVNPQIINQLSSEISKATSDANIAAQGYANVAKSFEEVKNTTDMLLMISITGIGIGAAGIVIAVVALTKKH